MSDQLMLKVVLAQRRGREGTEQPTVVTQFADRTGLIEWRTDTFEKFEDAQFREKYAVLATLFPIDAEVAVMQLLEQLREHEGASVTINCPNPDFNDQPDQVIEVCDDWTGWESRRFGGATLLDACKAAVAAKQGAEPVKAAAANPFALYADHAEKPLAETRLSNLIGEFLEDLHALQCAFNHVGASDTASREATAMYVAHKLGLAITEPDGASCVIDGVPVRLKQDAHGMQLYVRGRESPCAVLDIYSNQVQLCAFDQRQDEPAVLIKFDVLGNIYRIEPTARVAARVRS